MNFSIRAKNCTYRGQLSVILGCGHIQTMENKSHILRDFINLVIYSINAYTIVACRWALFVIRLHG